MRIAAGSRAAAAAIGLLGLIGLAAASAQGDSQGQVSEEFGIDVDAVFATPDDWDYVPSKRSILDENSEISYPITLAEEQWQTLLDPFEYYVLREEGTEYPFTGPLNDNKESGIYYSRATGQPLFRSDDKFDSRTGWPSFTKPINPDAIVYLADTRLSLLRIEVVDSLSGSHLGHVFNDGPAPTGQRYCINSASLVFVPDGEDPPPIYEELQRLAAAGD